MIQMIQKSSEKSSKIYECRACDYTTSRKSQFDRHLSTQKHKNRQNDTNDTKKFHLVPTNLFAIVVRDTHINKIYTDTKRLANQLF